MYHEENGYITKTLSDVFTMGKNMFFFFFLFFFLISNFRILIFRACLFIFFKDIFLFQKIKRTRK